MSSPFSLSPVWSRCPNLRRTPLYLGLIEHGVKREVLLAPLQHNQRAFFFWCIFCMASAWIRPVDTATQSAKAPRGKCSVPSATYCLTQCIACLGLAQFIDFCKKSTVARGLAALSFHNRLHSYGAFYSSHCSRWWMDMMSTSLWICSLLSFFFSPLSSFFLLLPHFLSSLVKRELFFF